MIKQKGFTIIELLVVVAIIGILTAIGTLFFRGHIKSTKETVARNHLKNIHLAQEEYNADNNTYYSSGNNCSDHSQVIDTNLFSGDNVLKEDKNFYYCVIGANNNTEYIEFMLHTSELMPGGSNRFNTIDLIENGRNIPVTNENKLEYILKK